MCTLSFDHLCHSSTALELEGEGGLYLRVIKTFFVCNNQTIYLCYRGSFKEYIRALVQIFRFSDFQTNVNNFSKLSCYLETLAVLNYS